MKWPPDTAPTPLTEEERRQLEERWTFVDRLVVVTIAIMVLMGLVNLFFGEGG